MSNNRVKVVRATTHTLPVNAPLGELIFDTERNELWVGMGEDAPLKQITDSKIINLEKVFDSLIINAGNSNAEIVDARTDYFGAYHPTLKSRLNNQDKRLDKLLGGLPNLGENIKEANAINEDLKVNTSLAKIEDTKLQDSIKKTQDFISSLDGSQNIPQIRMDVTELQNGLKSNQALEYSGSYISANDTLEGRTEGMRICGRTLVNLASNVLVKRTLKDSGITYATIPVIAKNNTEYTLVLDVTKNTTSKNADYWGIYLDSAVTQDSIVSGSISTGLTKGGFTGRYIFKFRSKDVGSITNMGIGMHNDYSETYEFEATAMLLEGDWTNKPIPQYFEGIKSFGQQEDKISILSSGKNLFNETKSEEGLLNVNTGEIYKTNTSCTSDYIKVEKGKSYVLNGDGELRGYYGVLFDNNKTYVSHKAYSKNISINFEQDGYFRFSYASKINTEETPATNIIFEEGSQATTYEPYKEDKKDILIKEPLRSVGDVYDVMYEYDNKIMAEKNIGKIKIDGRVAPVIFSQFSTNTHIAFYISVEGENNYGLPVYPDEAFAFKGNGDTVLCDKFKISDKIVLSDISDEAVCLVNASPNYVGFKILKSKIKTGDITYDDIKEYLKENPVTVYYQKAEPTIEVVENCVDIDLDTFGEKTYFNILNSLPGTLDFKVPSNIASIVQANSKSINDLYDIIKDVVMPSIMSLGTKLASTIINNGLK